MIQKKLNDIKQISKMEGGGSYIQLPYDHDHDGPNNSFGVDQKLKMAKNYIAPVIISHEFNPGEQFRDFFHLSSGVEKFFGQAQAQGFLNFFIPSPVSDLPSPNL